MELEHETALAEPPVSIISLDFKKPGLAETVTGKKVVEINRHFNQMAALAQAGLGLEERTKQKAVVTELEDHFKLTGKIRKPEAEVKLSLSREDLASVGMETIERLTPEQKRSITIPIEDDVNVRAMYEKMYMIRHEIAKVFTLVEAYSHPSLDSYYNPEVYMQRISHALSESPKLYLDIYDKEPIAADTVQSRIVSRMEIILRSGIRPPNFPPLESLVLYQKPTITDTSVTFSESWLAVLGEDIAQNINRATKNAQNTLVSLSTHLSEDGSELIVRVRNTNSQFPQKIIDEGFQEGVGENEDGEHIGMAKLARIIREQYGGDLRAYNERDESQDDWAVVEFRLPVDN